MNAHIIIINTINLTMMSECINFVMCNQTPLNFRLLRSLQVLRILTCAPMHSDYALMGCTLQNNRLATILHQQCQAPLPCFNFDEFETFAENDEHEIKNALNQCMQMQPGLVLIKLKERISTVTVENAIKIFTGCMKYIRRVTEHEILLNALLDLKYSFVIAKPRIKEKIAQNSKHRRAVELKRLLHNFDTKFKLLYSTIQLKDNGFQQAIVSQTSMSEIDFKSEITEVLNRYKHLRMAYAE